MKPALTPLEHPEQWNTSERLLEEAGDLPYATDLLDQVEAIMRDCGLAGSARASITCYVAITSRHFARPMNVSVVGTSAIGKNRKVDYARNLHPPEACHVLSASSPKAVIYAGREDEDYFKNRMIFWAEADSIPEDGSGGSAIRALVYGEEMTYEVTEKGPDGRFRSAHIRKNGPTGLITTGVRPLSPQHRTRVIEIVLEESEPEIRAVLLASAREGEPGPEPDLRPFVAFQEWLEHYGCKDVTIPYADTLAQLVPARSASVQRMFPFLLTCIRTSAFLHQFQRPRSADGCVVATLDDYRLAYELLKPSFEAHATEGVTPVVRETVEAIQPGECISMMELARRLGIPKSTAWRRVQAAQAGDWIVNRETRRGLPAQLKLGDPLPSGIVALPTPDELSATSLRRSA